MKELPRRSTRASQAVGLLILLACLAATFLFWYDTSSTMFEEDLSSILIALGRAAGFFAAWLLIVQLILISREHRIESSFGLDRLTLAHHLNGLLIPLFIGAHVFALTYGYALRKDRTYFEQAMVFLRDWEDVLDAAIGVLLLVVVVILSITFVKKRLKYESWYFVHLLTYLAAFLVVGHQFESGFDLANNQTFAIFWAIVLLLVILNLAAFRFAKPLFLLHKHRFSIDRFEQDAAGVVSLYVQGRNLSALSIRGGQFFILRFLTKKLWLQAHPFSLSCAPNDSYLRFTIKAVGDFTAELPLIHRGTPILIEGPFGKFTAENCKKEKVLLLAGGIGITPIRSICDELIQQKKDIILLYGNRTERDIALRTEVEELAKNSCLQLTHVLSAAPSDWTGEKGHLDKKKIQRLVPDVFSREIFLCGPPPMMQMLIGSLLSLGVKKRHLHYERFSL